MFKQMATRNGTFKRQRTAQTTVEFALILWPFLMIMFACCDYAQFYFYEHSLRYALYTAGRSATPGNVLGTNSYNTNSMGYMTNCPLNSSYSAGNWISRYESIRRVFSNNCAISMPLKSLIITNSSVLNPTQDHVGPGYANDYITIQVKYTLTFITPIAALMTTSGNGVFTNYIQGTFINEPSQNFNTYTNYYGGEGP